MLLNCARPDHEVGGNRGATAQRIVHTCGTRDDNPPDLLMFRLPPESALNPQPGGQP